MATKNTTRSSKRAEAEPVAKSRANSSSTSKSASKAVAAKKAAPKKSTAAAVEKPAKKAPAKTAPASKKAPAKAAATKKAAPKTSAKTKAEELDMIELVDDSDQTMVKTPRGRQEIELIEEVADEEIELAEEEEIELPEIPIDYNDENTVLFTERNRIKADLAKAMAVPERRRSKLQQRRISSLVREMDTITTRIVKFNYGLVRSYTKKFTSNSSKEDSADFEASAVVGLMRAIDSFDPTKGRFGAWAYKPIQREVLRAVRDADFKSMNPGDFERRPDILRAVTKLQAGDETRMPTNAAVAAEARVTVDQVRRVLEAPHLESIHQHVGDDGGTELGDLIESDTTRVEGAVISSMTLTALEDYGFRALDERELFVLVRRFGLDSEPEQKLASIGDMLGLSREAVRQVEAKGLAKLMHPTILRKIVRYGRA
jgi:RNA polymerase sigma factor (sigma-70 family)